MMAGGLRPGGKDLLIVVVITVQLVLDVGLGPTATAGEQKGAYKYNIILHRHIFYYITQTYIILYYTDRYIYIIQR